jgi:hypothetical protein
MKMKNIYITWNIETLNLKIMNKIMNACLLQRSGRQDNEQDNKLILFKIKEKDLP